MAVDKPVVVGDEWTFTHRDKRTAYVVEHVEGGGDHATYVKLLNPVTQKHACVTDGWLTGRAPVPGTDWQKVE